MQVEGFNTSGKSILVVSTEPWFSPLLSKHHIVLELCKRNKVLYMEPFYHLGSILKGRLPRHGYNNRYHENRPENLLMMQPWRLPRTQASKLIRYFSEVIVMAQLRSKDFRPDWILSFSPFFSFLKDRLKVPFIYYAVDSYPEHQSFEGETLSKSDLVVAATEKLHKHFEGRTKRLKYLPHGVSLNIVADAGEPEELVGLPQPILGFVGALNEYFDIELLEKLSRAFAAMSIVLIGPYQEGDFGGGLANDMLDRIRELANVRLLGPRPSDKLGPYISCFDVCLVLKDNSHPLVHFSYSKVLQYLALGKPVVTTCFASDSVLPPNVAVAEDDDSFIEAVSRALTSHDSFAAARCRAFASKNTWEQRVVQISDWLAEVG